MSANYKQLSKFAKDIERLNAAQKEEFLEACCKELAARLLQKVIENTASVTGNLRRGWTAGQQVSPSQYANDLSIRKQGNSYILDIINPVDYASYYEYGHRTSNGAGWVEGRFPLTIAEAELNAVSDAILAKKLRKYMKGVFGE